MHLKKLNILIFFFIVIVFLLINCIKSQQVNLICTDEFCEEYKDSVGCPGLADACVIQNSTHNGQIFPSATPCGCCQVCLQHLSEGEYCSIGAPGSPVPNFMCGPGLYCYADLDGIDVHPKCVRMSNTECTRQQIEFDREWEEGNIGHLMRRPLCDDDGNFQPIKCIPGQICYCVDKNGKRIFGEAIHTSLTETTMKCECSRLAATFADLMHSPYPQFTARCLDDGSYDPIQCIDDQCVCVDSNSGTIVDSTVYNATLGLADMEECFDKEIHKNHTYLHACEAIEMEKVYEVVELEDEGYKILDFHLNICEQNGWFKRVHETDEYKFCSDKYGNQIENFRVSKNSPDADDMNCNCARARLLMIENNLRELPICRPNGNYENIACRRSECYCVDENGIQISKEVAQSFINTLPCYYEEADEEDEVDEENEQTVEDAEEQLL